MKSQSRVLELGFADLSSSLLIFSRGETVAGALNAFSAASTNSATRPSTPAQSQALVDYYNARFAGADDGRLDVNALIPTSIATRYLQSRYTVPFADRDQAVRVDDARDGSRWSAANARYNGYFREIATRMGFRDAFLINARGDVVYSAYKGVELGTNVLTGPYRGEGNLPDAFRKAMASNDIDYVDITDFAEYLPVGATYGLDAGSGRADPGRAAGVMAVEYPASVVNNLMTADRQWERAGMGRTGETFLVGNDDLMRSDSRLFLEDQEAYRRDVIDAGTPPDVADRAIKQGTTVLVQPVGTKAGRGRATRRDRNRDRHRLPRPPRPAGLRAAETQRAGLGHRRLDRLRRGIRPGARLRPPTGPVDRDDHLHRLSGRDAVGTVVRPSRSNDSRRAPSRSAPATTTSSLPVNSRDEFGDLTVAFNEMSRNLAIKDQLLTEQRDENERLLLSLMPESVVERYRDGEETIAEEHQDVTVIFADLVGLDELSSDLGRRGVPGDHQQTGAAVRRRRREPRRRAGAQHPQRLSGQLRADRAAAGQHSPHRRFRHRHAADRRPVQRRDGPQHRSCGPGSIPAR